MNHTTTARVVGKIIHAAALTFGASLLAIGPAVGQSTDRRYEGDWYVSDQTDNVTGEREVYAFQVFLEPTEQVTITMRCKSARPIFIVDWQKIALPDQAVLTIGPVTDSDSEPDERSYVFEKAKDGYREELLASPETSAQIIAAIGQAPYATITAHTAYGSKTVGIKVGGTQGAWRRVSRHCPAPIMPLPPL